MTPLIEKTWDLISVGADIICQEDEQITSNLTEKEEYKKIFKDLYSQILEYMDSQEKPLDRHKIAAIIIVSILRLNVLQTSKQEEIFMGNYILASEVGLSYMIGTLNEKLEEINKKRIDKFYFPKAMSCKTDYFRIFYRNLYFANNNKAWGLNPLDIAERLFLLEYMTLEKNAISPSILNEY